MSPHVVNAHRKLVGTSLTFVITQMPSFLQPV